MRTYTIKEVADMLQVVPETVKNMSKRGDLPPKLSVSSQWRFDADAVDAKLGEKK